MSRSYDSSSGSSSDRSSDYKARPRRRRRRRRDPPPASSTTPCLIVGIVIVLSAAIGAITYILKRPGGGGSSFPDLPRSSSPKNGEDAGEKLQDSNMQKPTKTAAPGDSPSKGSSSTGNTLKLDFTTLASTEELETYLNENGFSVATDFIETKPITHTFRKENIDWSDGALRMIVKGQKGSGDISSSEFGTNEAFLYGRVTTRAKTSPVPGVCHGFFWYTNDNLEVDIEILTSYVTEGLGDAVKPGLQLTNQALSPGESSTNMVVPYGFDPTTDFHDYTIDWSEGISTFFVDGKEVGKLEENVPSEPMKFVWNSWSSGEPNWSAGPPREDSFLYIESIEAEWTVAK